MAVGAVVGGLANLLDTDVLFPGWGVVAGALIGLGCGLVLAPRGEGPEAAGADDAVAVDRGATAGADDVGDAEPLVDDAVEETTSRGGVGGAKARVIARSSGAADDAPSDGAAAPALAKAGDAVGPDETSGGKDETPGGKGGTAGGKGETAGRKAGKGSKGDSGTQVVPKEAIVAARPLTRSPAAGYEDDLVAITVHGGGLAATATGRARGDRVRRVAVAAPESPSSAASQWAELLVDGFSSASDPSCTDVAPFGKLLSVSRRAWGAAHEGPAATSFVGVEVVDLPGGGAAWRGVVAGTSALLVVSGGAIVARLPASAGDAGDPLPASRSGDDRLRRASGSLAAGDAVLLCTRRVAQWVGADRRRAGRLVDLDGELDIPGDGPAAVARIRIRPA